MQINDAMQSIVYIMWKRTKWKKKPTEIQYIIINWNMIYLNVLILRDWLRLKFEWKANCQFSLSTGLNGLKAAYPYTIYNIFVWKNCHIQVNSDYLFGCLHLTPNKFVIAEHNVCRNWII